MTSISTFARAARLGSTRKRGVTLIEAVLYISIALALIVGGLVFFQQASLAQRINSAVRSLSAIAAETRGLYQQQGSFAGFNHATLITAGSVPSSLLNAAGQMQNEWGGVITAGPTAALAAVPPAGGVGGVQAFAANSGFFVVYPNVPITACSRLVSVDKYGTGPLGNRIRSVTFGTGTPIYPTRSYGLPGGGTVWSTELEPGDARNFCRDASVNGVVTVRIDFDP
jgi:type II secretory pathway pseudopilin PulG